MTKKDAFEQLAKENGIVCRSFNNTRLDMHYQLPYDHPSRIFSVWIIGPYGKYAEDAEKGCILKFSHVTSSNQYSRVVFYLNTVEEAYALLFALVFLPDKVHYEFLSGKTRTEVTREEFQSSGKKRESFRTLIESGPFLLSLLIGLLRILACFVFSPILSLYDVMFRRYEFLFDKVGDEFVLTRHTCFGPFNKRSARRTWMIQEGE